MNGVEVAISMSSARARTPYSRGLLIAVALFLFFDLSAIALNFWQSLEVERGAVAINLAGRQRMLSQRMAKSLLQMEHDLQFGLSTDRAQRELRDAYALFDGTLSGFAEGRDTLDGYGRPVYLEPVRASSVTVVLEEAMTSWAPWRSHLKRVMDARPDQLPQVIGPAMPYARADNLLLLDQMNRLTGALEAWTQQEAGRIRLLLGVTFSLALGTFFFSMWLYAKRMQMTRLQHDLLDEVLHKVSAAVVVLDTDADTIFRTNDTMARMFGYGEEALVGLRVSTLLRPQGEDLVGHRSDGSTFIASTERHEAMWESRKLFVETVMDVTTQRSTEAHLSGLAYNDPLTNLPNRLLFDDRLQVGMARARREHGRLGLLFMDLDGFKAVNDAHGHDVGDLLLKAVAMRLQQALRASDTVSRRGGDEFTLILHDVADREACQRVADSLTDQLTAPFVLQGQSLRVGASIGIAVFPDDGGDADALMAVADSDMYRSKRERSTVVRA